MKDNVEKLTQEMVWGYIQLGDPEFDLERLRSRYHIDPESSTFYMAIKRLLADKKLRRLGRGHYRRIDKVLPVSVFGTGRERRPPFNLIFPRDFTTDMELEFADSIVIREGDLITIGGVKSTGKTQLCLNFCAENIDLSPVLMGNEYTIFSEGVHEPSPRFLERLDRMSEWVTWVNGNGEDKFILLPVSEDYAEHVIANKLNIVDWINLDAGALYDVGDVLKGIKAAAGRGVSVAALQKGEGAINPRGGQFVRDFSDLEILLDPFGKNPHDVLLTIKGAKETTKSVVGKTYAYTIGEGGTKIFNFREVRKCKGCSGSKIFKGHDCEECLGTGWTSR